MRRREFIVLLGAASAWPLGARAQQASRVRVGFVDFAGENDPNALDRARVFKRGLERLGWAPMIDYYWSVFNVERAQRAARDVLKLTPDVIVCAGTPATMALKQATSTVPIVFAIVTEPVAQGIVESLAHPGGNLTGFSYLEPTVGAKWLELLTQIAPHLKHVALMFNPGSSPYAQMYFQSIETATSRFAVQAVMAPAKLAEQCAITSGILIDRAEEARQMAMRLEKPGEAIRAIETIAKLCGLWKEKPGAQNQFNGPVTFEVHYTRESVSNEPHPHTIELQGSSAV